MCIYLDNAATSFPKPKSVSEDMYTFIKEMGATSGRGAYQKALLSDQIVYQTRVKIANFFHFSDPKRVVFTKNITESINIVLNGYLKPEDHVLISTLEHNAVWRCLETLKKKLCITIDIIPSKSSGIVDLNALENLINSKTKLVVINHASNVLGTVQPIRKIGDIIHRYGIPLVVDTAQTAGHIPIDMIKDNIDILTFTGHKGLLGPMGIGGLIVSDSIEINPLISGGTGSDSSIPYQPDYYPDHLEAGTLNIPGIIGLNAGISFIQSVGIEKIHQTLKDLYNYLLTKLKTIPNIHIYGPQNVNQTISVLSFNIANFQPESVAFYLDQYYHIMIRAGLHCSPLSHKFNGTLTHGTCRIGLGFFNKTSDIDRLIEALNALVHHKGDTICI